LINALDSQDSANRKVRLMAVQPAQLPSVRRAVSLIQTANGPTLPLAALVMQPRPDGNPATEAGPATAVPPLPGPRPDAAAAPAARGGEKQPDFSGLSRIVNPVQVEVIEGLDVLVLRGSAQDVEQLMDVVHLVETITHDTEPAIEPVPMKHLDCQAMAALVKALYDEVYQARQGSVSITPLVVPNMILLVGRPENVKTAKDLINRLDQPAVPGTQFQVFHLQYASPATAQAEIQNFFSDRVGLNPVVRITADSRTAALIVQASPRDMAEVAELIRQIDVIKINNGGPVNEVRIIRLEHTLATDIAGIMQAAISGGTGGVGGQQANQGQGGQPFGQGGQPFGQGGQPGAPGQNLSATPGGTQRAAMLRFLTVDAKGRKLLSSGLLSEVHITPDVRANALIISSPVENLELLEGLVQQLDNLPAAEAQIKVFTIVNGDATNLSDMLKTLITGQPSSGGQQGGAGAFFPMLQMASASGSQTSLVPLRFGVDTRTNSVIASGTMGDLNIVEAILTKLDDGEVRHRKSVVIRLKNSPATDVATTINTFLTSERQILQQAGPGLTSAFEQIEREVVVVAEPVTNSLVLSATPRFFEEVRGIVEQLDARPPMVMIQVMIASVELGSTNEFGIELGLQDSVLFDRSILSNLQTTTNTTASGASTTTLVSANASPGFNFNNGGDLGNSGNLPPSTGIITNTSPGAVGSQGISNFGVGRTNSTLGYSGLVLSAASENISALLRALSENHRVDILQRPQVMTLDNQPAFIQVGQRVPRITSVSNNALTGNTNSITLDNVGLILGVTPRISPDGLVVMQIDAEKSELESDATGIPIFTSPTGQVVRSPIIDATTAQTTVAAMSEQTVILGGLITKSKSKEHHGVPVLDDIPVINNFFRYDSTIEEKTELLIIMTPHIVRNQADAEALKRTEAAKMTWCMCDVTAMYGEAGLRRRTDDWTDSEVPVIYPDSGPLPASGQPAGPEMVPAPSAQPAGPGAAKPAAPAPAAPVPSPTSPSAGGGVTPQPVAPMPGDPSAAMQRLPATQPPQYWAPQSPAAGVQPAAYQPQPWQAGNTAQPAVYQAPGGERPASFSLPPSDNQQPPYEAMPPAYYPPGQGGGQK
jgi:type II secretion system protein D